MSNKKVLISFVGGSDPTRSDYDGPLLQIIRHEQPNQIYLIYSYDFYHDEKRRQTILAHLNYMKQKLNIDFLIVEQELKSSYIVNDYDIIKDIYTHLNKTLQNHNEDHLLINISSGTPQLTAGLLIYAKFNINHARLKLLQVSTPSKKINIEPSNLDENPENNLNYQLDTTKRVQEVSFDLFFAAINKTIFVDLIQTYQYDKAKSLLEIINFKNDSIDNNLQLIEQYLNLDKQIIQNHYNVTHLNQETYHFIRYFNVLTTKYQIEDNRNFFIMSSVIIFEMTYELIKHHFDELTRDKKGKIYVKQDVSKTPLYQNDLNKYLKISPVSEDLKEIIFDLTQKRVSQIRNAYAHNFIVKMDLKRKELKNILSKIKKVLMLHFTKIQEEDFDVIQKFNEDIIEDFNK